MAWAAGSSQMDMIAEAQERSSRQYKPERHAQRIRMEIHQSGANDFVWGCYVPVAFIFLGFSLKICLDSLAWSSNTSDATRANPSIPKTQFESITFSIFKTHNHQIRF